jgi:hypothetical protein
MVYSPHTAQQNVTLHVHACAETKNTSVFV